MANLWALLVSLAVLHWQSTSAQTVDTCADPATPYRCVGNFHYQICGFERIYDSVSSPFASQGPVCYPGYDPAVASDLMMQAAPPACTAEGRFSLRDSTGRCDLYYVCSATGRTGEYNWAISSCRAPFEFSPWEHKCVPAAAAGCSITTTTTQAPTTLAPCVVGTRSPDPTACRKYYECRNPPSPTRLDCPFNYFFDSVTSTCGANSAVCGIRPFLATVKLSVGNKIAKDRVRREAPWYFNLLQ